MSEVDVVVWLSCGYAAFLLLAAYGLDLMAKRTSRHTADWRSGSFTYHEDHDAWVARRTSGCGRSHSTRSTG